MKNIKYLKIGFENCEVYKIESKFILDFSYKKSFKIDKYDSEKNLLSMEEDTQSCELCFRLDNSFLKSVNKHNLLTIISRIKRNDICYYELFDENDELFERVHVPYYEHQYESLQTNKFEIQLDKSYVVTITH
jgi:hypothetical protein